MKRRGISLIVLIVTIIVIIILAAVVILTISKNNPIESAKEASFKEDIRTFQDELAMYISKDYTNKAGARDDKITATNYNPAGDPASVYTYIPSFSKKYEGKFVIKNDELMYCEGKLTEEEKSWSENLNVKLNQKTGAEKAKDEPQKYYGAKVKYTAPNGVNDWKIFYSDGRNIYLITSEYVDVDKLPQKDGAKPENNESSLPKSAPLTNIRTKYNGSSDITDEKMKAFNSDYFKNNYSSTRDNMKEVAYMLDFDIWNDFANSNYAEYAVGGPSVEMVLKSYCEIYPDKDYRTQATCLYGYLYGYLVSNDGGTNWVDYCGMLNESEELYVLPESKGARAMWLCSPSARDYCALVIVNSAGGINNNKSDTSANGFRPLVCLNSNIMLNEAEGGYEISQ